MRKNIKIRPQTKIEERVNWLTHAFGVLMSLVAVVLMTERARMLGDTVKVISVGIFGACMFLLYLASTAYHSVQNLRLKVRLNKLDHSAIFFLIAGTYTPFTLIVLRGLWGNILFILVWVLALLGVFSKVFFMEKVYRFSTLMYVSMGWIILVAIKPMVERIDWPGLLWVLAGAIFYNAGVFFYLRQEKKFAHALFHLLVLCGSVCHVLAVYYYVLN